MLFPKLLPILAVAPFSPKGVLPSNRLMGLHCAVPGNIHMPHWKFWGGGGSQKPNWIFQRGGVPPLGRCRYFSGTTHFLDWIDCTGVTFFTQLQRNYHTLGHYNLLRKYKMSAALPPCNIWLRIDSTKGVAWLAWGGGEGLVCSHIKVTEVRLALSIFEWLCSLFLRKCFV